MIKSDHASLYLHTGYPESMKQQLSQKIQIGFIKFLQNIHFWKTNKKGQWRPNE